MNRRSSHTLTVTEWLPPPLFCMTLWLTHSSPNCFLHDWLLPAEIVRNGIVRKYALVFEEANSFEHLVWAKCFDILPNVLFYSQKGLLIF